MKVGYFAREGVWASEASLNLLSLPYSLKWLLKHLFWIKGTLGHIMETLELEAFSTPSSSLFQYLAFCKCSAVMSA